MIKQKDAVFAAITEAQGNKLEGKEAIAYAVEKVSAGLMDKTVQHSTGFTDPAKALGYARSLVANWMSKDTRLNGGEKYAPKTKRGPQVKDERLRTLKESHKSLIAHQADPALIAKVEAAMQARQAEVQAEKSQANVPSLDETLASLADLGIEVA
jgi:hypothetical protein